MIILYQSTFWLALALLAIVITAFVLAVSLLGRAIRISVKEQETVEQEKRESSSEQIKKFNSQLNEAIEKDEQPDIDSLKKQINDLQKQLRHANWRLRWICFKPKLLRVTWGALFPASLFIISIVTSSLALFYDPSSHSIALFLWYTSICFITLGSILIILTLTVIQDVASSTDETSFIRQKEMMKSAMVEVEEEKKPGIEVIFNKQLPFDLISTQPTEIAFRLTMTKGYIAKSTKIMFFAPKGFDFPGLPTLIQQDWVADVAGHLSTQLDIGDYIKGFDPFRILKITSPPEKGSYQLWYKVVSEAFNGVLTPFEVKVI